MSRSFRFTPFWVLIICLCFVSCSRKTKEGELINANSNSRFLCIYDSMGFKLQKQYKYDSALFLFRKAMAIAKSEENNIFCAKINQNIGDNFYYASQIDSSYYYYSRAANLFHKAGSKEDYSSNLNNMAICFAISGDYDSSQKYMQKALDISTELYDTANILDLHQNLGVIYGEMGNYSKAASHTLKALQIAELKSDSGAVIGISGNLFELYERNADSNKAYAVLMRSKMFFNKSLDIEATVGFIHNIGSIYMNYKKNLDSAEYHYKDLLGISQKSNFKRGEAAAFSCLADICDKKNNLQQAKLYSKTSLDIEYNQNRPYGIVESGLQLAEFYQRLDLYDSSFIILNQVLDVAKENNINEYFSDIYEGLYLYYREKADFKKALEAYEVFFSEKKKLTGIEIQQEILDVEAKYKTEKSQRQIDKLDAQNRIQNQQIKVRNSVLFASLILIAGVIVVFILVLRQSKLQSKFRQIELEQRLFRAQLRPHFVFNVLNSLKYFIQKSNTTDALKHLNSFSRLMRKTLQQTSSEEVLLKYELEMLEDYIQLESTKFAGNLEYSCTIEDSINIEKIVIPPFILQPFVENSFVHGFKDSGANNMIKVSVARLDVNKELCITIVDNGGGIMKTIEKPEHESKGTELTRKRIKFFNKKMGLRKEPFTISSIEKTGKDCSGTIVRLILALKEVQND